MAPDCKELSEDLKKRSVALHKDGRGFKKIANTLKLSYSMVAKTIQRFNRTGSTQNRPRHGASKKFSAHAQHHIQRSCFKNRHRIAASIVAKVKGVRGQPVSRPNPIEHLWVILKQKVSERKLSKIHQSCDAVMEEWKRITVATCEALVNSMPKSLGRKTSEQENNSGHCEVDPDVQPADIYGIPTVNVGGEMKLKCSTFGRHPSSGEVIMYLCKNGVGVKMELLEQKDEHTFIFKNVSEQDSGNYSCVYSLNKYTPNKDQVLNWHRDVRCGYRNGSSSPEPCEYSTIMEDMKPESQQPAGEAPVYGKVQIKKMKKDKTCDAFVLYK
ncbi:hypothetical protein NFI96_009954 [Prochilodus magdalenae]|nr:hypothetical protein NFI96_009954 [Prochilodus magdalenae]